jgi:predicted transcriptional regulator
MRYISKFEKEKLLHLLECSEEELNNLTENSNTLLEEKSSIYDILLKILQQGLNIREATLTAIILGKKIGYNTAKTEMEEEIKDQLYKAFKNSQ